jgi:hypothetical protein
MHPLGDAEHKQHHFLIFAGCVYTICVLFLFFYLTDVRSGFHCQRSFFSRYSIWLTHFYQFLQHRPIKRYVCIQNNQEEIEGSQLVNNEI